MSKKEFLTTKEVAKIFGISRVAVFKKIKKGEIPAQKIGRNYAIRRNDVSPALDETITPREKEFITSTTNTVVEEYGEALRRLAKE